MSIRLTKNTSTIKVHLKTISLTAVGGKRIKASFIPYPKLQELINKYPICDPLIFERSGQFWLNLAFETPKIDNVTNKKEGERRGNRFYSKSGITYDADINAAINIAKRSNLPISQTNNLTYGQVIVNLPIVDGSHSQATRL